MPSLLYPLGLAALAALLLPVLIHLIRRPEQQRVDFAALRWLAGHTQPRSRLRLHEPLLLALRLALLAVLALLLAMPVLHERVGADAAPWIVVAPGISADAAQAAIDLPGAQWRRLAPGYPPLASADEVTATYSASLVRQLDSELPAGIALTLLVPPELAGLDAERLQLGRKFDWRVVAGAMAPPSAGTAAATPIHLSLRHDAQGADELVVAQALAAAWQASDPALQLDVATTDAPLPGDSTWLIWLSDAPLPPAINDWIAGGGTALLTRQKQAEGIGVLADARAQALLHERPLGQGRILASTQALTPSAMPALLQPDFPARLYRLLQAPATPPDRALAASVTPLQRAELSRGPQRPLDRWLLIAALLLFIAERLWALRPQRSGT